MRRSKNFSQRGGGSGCPSDKEGSDRFTILKPGHALGNRGERSGPAPSGSAPKLYIILKVNMFFFYLVPKLLGKTGA